MRPLISVKPMKRLLGDRRGVSAIAFAGLSTVLVGATALVADATVWYVNKRGAQNAADAAAAAGAAMAGSGSAATTAQDVSRRNGYQNGATNTTVTVTEPGGGVVRVDVVRTITPGLARLFGVNTVDVRASAAARLFESGNVCGLTLTGSLIVTGSATVTAPGCVLASNKRGADSIQIGNAATLSAENLVGAGACVGCTPDLVSQSCPNPPTSGSVCLAAQPRSYAPPITNPLGYLDDNGLGLSSNCLANGDPPEPFERGGRMICGNQLQLSGQTILDLSPGTYVLWNADLRMQGQSQLRCTGCTAGRGVTIFMTGDPSNIGGITINAGTIVDLVAPNVGPAEPGTWNAEWRGVLFYRDVRATNNKDVQINGDTASTMTGAMYFPSSETTVNGNANTNGCSLVVAAELTFSGNADTSTCQTNYGLQVPRARQVEFTL